MPSSCFKKNFDQSRELVVFLTYFLTEVARYAETDAKNKASKYIPSQEDLQVNTKIAGNELLVEDTGTALLPYRH